MPIEENSIKIWARLGRIGSNRRITTNTAVRSTSEVIALAASK